jgi:hypothetical protein
MNSIVINNDKQNTTQYSLIYENGEINFWMAALLSSTKETSKNKICTIKMMQSPEFGNE